MSMLLHACQHPACHGVCAVIWFASQPTLFVRLSHLTPQNTSQLNDLLDFASLNTEGFRKICKKFDKEHKDTTGQEMSQKMMSSSMAKEKVPMPGSCNCVDDRLQAVTTALTVDHLANVLSAMPCHCLTSLYSVLRCWSLYIKNSPIGFAKRRHQDCHR